MLMTEIFAQSFVIYKFSNLKEVLEYERRSNHPSNWSCCGR